MFRTTTKVNVVFLLVALILGFLSIEFPELPPGFSQPWKYRLLSIGAAKFDHIGSLCEYFGLFTRIEMIRALHYLSIGLFQQRHDEFRLKVFDRKIAGVHVRIYQPEETIEFEQKTTLVYFHGGGFVLGSIETYDQATYLLANLTRTTLISVEYRLAPEHRFPSALNDCFAVSRELFERPSDFEINSKRILLSGDSAGGNLALAVTQMLIADGFSPLLVCLLYPSLQFFDFTLPSYRSYFRHNVLGVLNEENFLSMISFLTSTEIRVTRDIFLNSHTTKTDRKHFARYLNPAEHLSNSHQINESIEENDHLVENLKFLLSPSMSPLLVPDELLSRLPTVLLFTTEFDILKDEGFIFASRLRSLNKTIYHHHFDNAFHGAHVFLYGPLRFEIAHEMIRHTSKILRNFLF